MHVVIVGGGFGGLKAALELEGTPGITVTLISERDHFVYYPALYSVATGGTQRKSFVPLSTVLEGRKITLVHDTIIGYDPIRKCISSATREYHYARVVFAMGVVTSYFGLRGLDRYSYGIKSYDEVKRFRNHLHDELVHSAHLDKQYVVVGAGPTGVELASSLSSYLEHITDAHRIKHSRIRIKLVEAAPRILPRMSESASQAVRSRLKSLGVTVMTNEKVEWQDDYEISVNGRSIPTRTVVWTSGVTNNPFFEKHSGLFTLLPNKKVEVDSHLMSELSTYVIGDNAGTPYSGMAQTALRDGVFVANDVKRVHFRRARKPYRSILPPVVIPVGRHWAILEWHGIRVTGLIGNSIRRVADLIGYYDILPFKTALSVWRTRDDHNGDCDTCREHQ